MTTITDAELTPAQRARAKIEAIEKRYKSPKNRIEKVNQEGAFWVDVYTAMGITDDPEIKEALQVYSEYVNNKYIGSGSTLVTVDGYTLFHRVSNLYGNNWYFEIWVKQGDKEQQLRTGQRPYTTKREAIAEAEKDLPTWKKWHESRLIQAKNIRKDDVIFLNLEVEWVYCYGYDPVTKALYLYIWNTPTSITVEPDTYFMKRSDFWK